jgi:hypothetical protein
VSKIERDRDGISFHNWHVLLWDTVNILSQERQKRGNPWRLVRRVPSSAIPVLATDSPIVTVYAKDLSHNLGNRAELVAW